MIRRSLRTEEDRRTRAKWMRRVGIIYGCIALLLFGMIAIIKPSSVASNGMTDLKVGSAGMPSERGDRDADGVQKSAVGGALTR
jgi:hypothetical protein